MSVEASRPLTVDSDDERMFRDSVRQFAERSIAPKVPEMERTKLMDPAIIREAFDLGLMGVEIPVEHGGAGASFTTAIIAIEELAAVDPAVSVCVDVQNTLVINAVLRWADPSQRARYLPRLCRDLLGSYCLSEPESGSDAFALRTRAVEDGDVYRLNGTKMWITSGGEAGFFLVFATVDPDKGYKGITAFLVERGFPGFSVGTREDKLGIRASSTVSLHFEDCIVPRANVLGQVGHGYKIAIETLNEGRIGIGAQMIGLARGALRHTRRHLLARRQFGRPLADFQGIQFQLADLATELEAARLLVYNAARRKDVGLPFVKHASMAKLFASRTAERIASQSVELHGGVGFTTEFPVEKFYRDAKIGTIYEGTSNMQLQTIARQVLSDDGAF
jgi:alkylation response protein AidB-like acyl-CoA dehydrogenase